MRDHTNYLAITRCDSRDAWTVLAVRPSKTEARAAGLARAIKLDLPPEQVASLRTITVGTAHTMRYALIY